MENGSDAIIHIRGNIITRPAFKGLSPADAEEARLRLIAGGLKPEPVILKEAA